MRIAAAREADFVAKEIEVGRYTFLLFNPALPSFLPSAMGSCRPVAAELLPRNFIHPSIHLSLTHTFHPPRPAYKVCGYYEMKWLLFPTNPLLVCETKHTIYLKQIQISRHTSFRSSKGGYLFNCQSEDSHAH